MTSIQFSGGLVADCLYLLNLSQENPKHRGFSSDGCAERVLTIVGLEVLVADGVVNAKDAVLQEALSLWVEEVLEVPTSKDNGDNE